MNVTMQMTITVMKILSVQTQMVVLHVNVKMDIQEMEQHVMVGDLITLLKRKSLFFTRHQ